MTVQASKLKSAEGKMQLESLQQEVKLLKQLHHPGNVKILAVITVSKKNDTIIGFIMPAAEGETLHHLIRDVRWATNIPCQLHMCMQRHGSWQMW